MCLYGILEAREATSTLASTIIPIGLLNTIFVESLRVENYPLPIFVLLRNGDMGLYLRIGREDFV